MQKVKKKKKSMHTTSDYCDPNLIITLGTPWMIRHSTLMKR